MADMYKKFFVHSCGNFKKQVEKKLKASNTVRNKGEPNFRTTQIFEIAWLIFNHCLGRYLGDEVPNPNLGDEGSTIRMEEECAVRSTPLYAIKTLRKLLYHLTADAVFRVHSKGDLTLISPWYSLAEPITVESEGNIHSFCVDWLVIPIRTAELMGNSVFCFLPSSGLDNGCVPW